MTQMIRVILVDDDQLLLEGLRCLLERQQDIQVVGVAADGLEALNLLKREPADVLVLDLQMPHDGFAVLEEVALLSLPIRTLVLTAHQDADNIRRVIGLGAHGFVPKNQSFVQVSEIIRQVARGWFVFPDFAQQSLMGLVTINSNLLSAREIEVLRYLSEGLLVSEIARELNLSKNTIGYHLKNIYEKLQVRNRTEAALWYFANHSSFT
jgi:DNA-binding NarL/FixJ family response regulator